MSFVSGHRRITKLGRMVSVKPYFSRGRNRSAGKMGYPRTHFGSGVPVGARSAAARRKRRRYYGLSV